MTGRQRIEAVFNRKPADRIAFWMGSPVEETLKIYYDYFKVKNHDELSLLLGDDARWVPAELAWKHPQGKPIWDTDSSHSGKMGVLADQAIFANCEDIKEIDKFDWPDPGYLDYKPIFEKMGMINANGQSVFGGPWTYIFQIAADFFGMENLFIKMYTDPDVVQAVIERVVDFYLIANKKFFEQAGDRLGVFFFANDLGSQEDLLISPELFKKFFLPGFKKIIEQAKSYNYKVMLHSCGAISRIIPFLIDAGIDALHPLQARARGMDAEYLAREYRNDLVFVGGVDTQELLPFGTPEQVKNEVRRLKKLFGERFVVSPSHEGVLPNIPPENILAMRDAALE